MKNKNIKIFSLISVLVLQLIWFIPAKALNLCAYVAADGKYACIPNSDGRAANPNANSCSVLPECKSNGTCYAIDQSKCGSFQKVYACKAGNGKYACSPSNDPLISDVLAVDGGCRDLDILQIDPSWCGKTDAQISGSNPTPPPSGGSNNGLPPPATDKLYNPLPEEELTHMFLFIAKGFLSIVAIWAVIFIIVGGFRMVVAGGDEEAITKAKRTVTWAVIGVVVAALSFSIIAIVQNLLNADIKQTTSNSSSQNGN